MSDKVHKNLQKQFRIFILTLVGVALVLVLVTCITIVKPGHSGVLVRLGKVSEHVIPAGPILKMPLADKVVQIDNRVQIVEANAASVSKDLQSISSLTALNYRIIPAQSAYMYKHIGMGIEETIVRPAIQECVKAITARFTAEELVVNRQAVGDQIKALIDEKVLAYGVQVEQFNIVDFGFSAEFNTAIEAKQKAQQEALKAEQELIRVRIDAQQVVEKTKADANAIKEKADAEAYAIQKIQEQLQKDPTYIEYIKAEKWDGILPQVTGSATPLIDLR